MCILYFILLCCVFAQDLESAFPYGSVAFRNNPESVQIGNETLKCLLTKILKYRKVIDIESGSMCVFGRGHDTSKGSVMNMLASNESSYAVSLLYTQSRLDKKQLSTQLMRLFAVDYDYISAMGRDSLCASEIELEKYRASIYKMLTEPGEGLSDVAKHDRVMWVVTGSKDGSGMDRTVVQYAQMSANDVGNYRHYSIAPEACPCCGYIMSTVWGLYFSK